MAFWEDMPKDEGRANGQNLVGSWMEAVGIRPRQGIPLLLGRSLISTQRQTCKRLRYPGHAIGHPLRHLPNRPNATSFLAILGIAYGAAIYK